MITRPMTSRNDFSLIRHQPLPAQLRAGLVASQMIGVAMARYVWRVGALAELDRDQVVRYVAPTIQRYLTGRLPASPQPPAVPAS
jgi:hypothetical protein